MMPIKSMFNEVQYELVKIVLLDVFLSTVILFLAVDLVALVFGMPLWYVIIGAVVYFVILLLHEMRKINLKIVEENNPELREILRTARDNVNDDTLMAHALFYEVIEKVRRISSGTFLDFRKIMTKLSTVFVLAVVLISLTFFNVNIQQFDNPLEKPLSAIGRWVGDITGNNGNATGLASDQYANDQLFGDPSMANLGNNQLVATVNPSLDSPDFSQVDPSQPSTDPLADIAGQGDTGFNTGEGYTQEGIDARDLQRSYEYAKNTQG